MRNGVRANPRPRPDTANPRRIGPALLRSAVVALLAGLAALSVSAPASAAPGDTDKVVKVFVVKDPSQTGGRPATLKTIATSTLGDSGRAAEIFDLNRGRAQPDGGALLDEGDALHPGWILRLPQDAAGPDVQLAKDNGGQSATGGGSSASPPADKAGTDGGTTTITTRTTALDVPLPAALAVAGAVLLALMTAAIVARQQVGRAFAPVGRAVRKLGDGRRRRRRLQERRLTGRRFAADAGSVRRAYGELALAAGTTDKPVHALRVGPDGATVWLAAPATMSAPWTRGDSTRWHRPADADGWLNRGAEGGGSESPSLDTEACLVRVGTDPDGEPVFVDLSRLDGVLSVTGDRDVVRDVAQNLLAEIARGRPGSPVTVLRGAEGALPLTLPPGLSQAGRQATGQIPARPVPVRGTVRGAAARRAVTGLVVVPSTPTEGEAAELAALCGPGGAGWTGLVCGEFNGAHWRWHADAYGKVDLPVLGLQLAVPA